MFTQSIFSVNGVYCMVTRVAEQYGGVIGEEARACGIRASLGPGMNLMRTPLNGTVGG